MSAPAARGRTLRTAPWRGAPLLLIGQPAVVLAIVAASVVLAVAAASGPLFLSEIGTASLHDQAAAHCPELAMPSASVSQGRYDQPYTLRTNEDIDQRMAAAYSEHRLPRPQNVMLGHGTIATGAEPKLMPQYATVFWRPHAADHVDKVASVGGRGIWITDYFAKQLRIRPGMNVYVDSHPVRVVGTYRRLDAPLDPTYQLDRYWCSWHDLIVQSVLANSSPAFAIATDRGIVVDHAAELTSTWFSRVDVADRTLEQASRDAAAGEAAGDRVQAELAPDRGVSVSSTFSRTAARARYIRSGISGAITPIAAGGVVVAMLLVAGAGMFWSMRRRREVRLLVSRGVGPVHLGAKALLETAPWVVAGGAAGFVLTLMLVRSLGPTRLLESDAPRTAGLVIVAVCAVALALVAVIAATAGRASRTRGLSAPSWARHVPWEVGLLVAAALVYRSTHGAGLVVDAQNTVQLRPALLAFPLLALTGLLLLVTRLLRFGMPWLRRAADRRRVPAFLAWSRVSGAPVAALALVIGVALPCSIVVYSSGLEDSLRTSVRAKYETNIGAPHVLRVVATGGTNLELHGTGTQVSVVEEQPLANGATVQILGVDPATFSHFAYVDDRQRAEVRDLAGRPGSSRLPAIVVNNDTGRPIRSVRILDDRLDLNVHASVPAFPGLRNPKEPLVVVDRRRLAGIPQHIERSEQVWTNERLRSAAIRVLERQEAPVLYELSPQVLVGDTGLLPVTWILDYLRALAVLIGLVAVTGVVFALAARAAQQTVAYVMAVRMGVRPRAHLTSLFAELALLIGLGWLLGTALAEVAAAAVYRLLDTLPEFPPAPSFVVEVGVIVVLAAIALAVILAAAFFAHAVARRARPSDAMRAP